MPTWKKLLLWFILSVLSSFVFGNWLFIGQYKPTLCLSSFCGESNSSMIFLVGIITFFTLGLVQVSDMILISPAMSVVFLVIHVIIYSIACFIVVKLKKK